VQRSSWKGHWREDIPRLATSVAISKSTWLFTSRGGSCAIVPVQGSAEQCCCGKEGRKEERKEAAGTGVLQSEDEERRRSCRLRSLG
jgi:hypothetical protein